MERPEARETTGSEPGLWPHDAARARSVLERDPLRHVVALKMLDAHPDATRICVSRTGPERGVLALVEASASPFDAATYPECTHVAAPSAADEAAAADLIAQVPAGARPVWKLADPAVRTALLRSGPCERVTGYVSFTAPAGVRFAPAPGVERTGLEEDCVPFYLENAYTEPELRDLFARGAQAFTLRRAGAPLASCFAFRNCRSVVEIAGLFTPPAERGRGHARRVVEAAVAWIVAAGELVRYQAHEENRASLALARSIGLERFLHVEHWLPRS